MKNPGLVLDHSAKDDLPLRGGNDECKWATRRAPGGRRVRAGRQPCFESDTASVNRTEAYDEVGLWRANVAKLLLNKGVRVYLVKVTVREPLTVAQLRATVKTA